MRHLRSIFYALVLAPAIWVLLAVGFTDDLSSRGRDFFAAESVSGLLLLIFGGILLAILSGGPVSPAGPVLAGAVYLGVTIWAWNSPAAYASLWAPEVAKEGFDLSRPGYGLAAVLAIPLLGTALSARRWARYEPPVLPIIGEIGRFRGAAKVAGTTVAAEQTTVIRTGGPGVPATVDADRTVAFNAGSFDASSDRTTVLAGADPTMVVANNDHTVFVAQPPAKPSAPAPQAAPRPAPATPATPASRAPLAAPAAAVPASVSPAAPASPAAPPSPAAAVSPAAPVSPPAPAPAPVRPKLFSESSQAPAAESEPTMMLFPPAAPAAKPEPEPTTQLDLPATPKPVPAPEPTTQLSPPATPKPAPVSEPTTQLSPPATPKPAPASEPTTRLSPPATAEPAADSEPTTQLAIVSDESTGEAETAPIVGGAVEKDEDTVVSAGAGGDRTRESVADPDATRPLYLPAKADAAVKTDAAPKAAADEATVPGGLVTPPDEETELLRLPAEPTAVIPAQRRPPAIES